MQTDHNPAKSTPTREQQVILLASEGLTDRQIAGELGISSDTVSTYWRRILARFDAASRTEVIAKMVRSEERQKANLVADLNEQLVTEIEAQSIATKQLELIHNRLRSLIDNITDAVIMENADHEIIFVNQKYCNMKSDTAVPEEFTGRIRLNLIRESLDKFVDGDAFYAQVDQIIKSGQKTLGTQFETADGRWLEQDFIPVHSDEDTLIGNIWLIRDITEKIKKANAATSQLRLATALSGVGPMLMRSIGRESQFAIESALKSIGEFTKVDRAFLFTFDLKLQTMTYSHEWCAAGISAEKDPDLQTPFDVFPWWISKLMNGEIIIINDIEKLPMQANSEKQHLISQGILSVIALPVINFDGKPIGFVGFDSVRVPKQWSEEEALLLRNLGEMMGYVIQPSSI
jgi:DNA-binding CsgD family transcriptional regulator